MNLYQAGYTRRGKQGEGAGWSIVFPSEDMSQAAKEGFSGFAGNLAELMNGNTMPKEAFGVFRYDRFVYFMNINYEASGKEAADARGVSFTHGYCFNLADYYALCEKPEQLLGVVDGTFRKEYDPSVKALPVAHKLDYTPMDYRKLMDKYGLDAESYRHLLIGATCALEGFANALCVKAERPLEEYRQVCREIMYLIMRGLPCHLRTKLTFFSYKGGKTGIYFSDRAEGNNYFDLDTKMHACDKSKLERYQFTQVYSLEDDRLRQRLLGAMAGFIDQAFDIQLKDIDCDQVEHAFQAQKKNELGKAIDDDLTISLLTSFMGYPLKEGGAVEEYLAVLLESISENDLQVKDSRILNRVVNRAQSSANPALHKSYLIFYARQILAKDDREGHNLLWKQYKEDKGQYAILIEAIERMDEGYYRNYFERAFLPSRLRSLQQVTSYLEESGAEAVSTRTFANLLRKVTTEEMEAARGFEGQLKVRGEVGRIASLMEQVSREAGRQYLLFADDLLWRGFEIAQFSLQDAERYRKCSLDELSRNGFNGTECEKARIVRDLLGIALDDALTTDRIYDIFFTDKTFDDITIKKVLQGILCKGQMAQCGFRSRDEVELSILCCYDLENDRMETAKWIRKVIKAGQEKLFKQEMLPKVVQGSRILSEGRLKKYVTKSLEKELEGKAWKVGEEGDKRVKHAMELLLACLRGEDPGSGEAMQAKQNFRFCLHKVAVGSLAAVAIGFFVWCLLKYCKWGSAPGIVAGSVAVVGTVTVLAVKIHMAGGIGDYFDSLGIQEPRELAIVGGFVAILAIFAIGLWFLVRLLPGLQGAASAGLKTIIAVAGCGIFAVVAIGGAAVGIFSGDKDEG